MIKYNSSHIYYAGLNKSLLHTKAEPEKPLETIAKLDENQLEEIAGGKDGAPETTCAGANSCVGGTSCEPGMSC